MEPVAAFTLRHLQRGRRVYPPSPNLQAPRAVSRFLYRPHYRRIKSESQESCAGADPFDFPRWFILRSQDNYAGVVMTRAQLKRAAAAILFSFIMACLLGLSGLLIGMYLWGRFGPPANDPDDTAAYFCGLLVGRLMAVGGGVALLWKFWPHAGSEHRNPAETR
jgi:hypothetical protein